jgi:ABC-2 type transport system permease protein
MKQFLTFVRKEFYHVFRDQKSLLMLFGVPIAQILLFGFALTNEIKNSSIAVFDFSNDEISRQVVQKITESPYFDLTVHVVSSANPEVEIEEVFQHQKAKIAVVIPDKFGQELLHQHKGQIQLVADASDPNTANTLVLYASNIIMDYQTQITGVQQLPYQIKTETRFLYNPELKGATNFVPGVMALVLSLICVLMTSVSIVREKENGTMEILLVSPFNPLMVVIAKAVPYFFLSLVNLTIILLLSVFFLDMPMNGSIVLLYFESTLLILTALALGLLISNITGSQQLAMMISLMGMLLPTLLFSGFMFPLENMPKPLQLFSNIVPAKWYYIIVKDIMVKGLGITAIWKETLILSGMALFFTVLSIKKFNVRLG